MRSDIYLKTAAMMGLMKPTYKLLCFLIGELEEAYNKDEGVKITHVKTYPILTKSDLSRSLDELVNRGLLVKNEDRTYSLPNEKVMYYKIENHGIYEILNGKDYMSMLPVEMLENQLSIRKNHKRIYSFKHLVTSYYMSASYDESYDTRKFEALRRLKNMSDLEVVDLIDNTEESEFDKLIKEYLNSYEA